MAAATPQDLLPQPPGGLVPGATLALLAHAALFVALTSVVQWKASAPEAISAELWSAVPQVAAPPAPPPVPARAPPPTPAPAPAPAPPPPKAEPVRPDPQIAIAQAKAEREKVVREKAERERNEKDRLRKEREAETERRALVETTKREQLAKEQKAEEQRLALQRQKNLDRLMGQVGDTSNSSSAGTAAQSSGPSASYTGRLVAAIKPNIVFTETVSGNPAAEVEVRAGASGSIIARRLLRSSGNKDWDEAVLRAIDRTGSLPRDVDGRVPPTLVIAFRPNE